MNAETWDRDLGSLADRLGQEGAISPRQADALRSLLAEVGALTRGRQARRGAVVRTAVPLTAEEQARFERAIQRFEPGRWVTFEVDPQLLGGVWLRVGDRIIDGSLRGRLEALRKQMLARGHE